MGILPSKEFYQSYIHTTTPHRNTIPLDTLHLQTPHGHPPPRHTTPHSPQTPLIRSTGGRYASYWNAFLFICGRSRCIFEIKTSERKVYIVSEISSHILSDNWYQCWKSQWYIWISKMELVLPYFCPFYIVFFCAFITVAYGVCDCLTMTLPFCLTSTSVYCLTLTLPYCLTLNLPYCMTLTIPCCLSLMLASLSVFRVMPLITYCLSFNMALTTAPPCWPVAPNTAITFLIVVHPY